MPTIILPAAAPPPPLPPVADGVTLADVERATAARLGPFFDVQATGGAPDSVTVPALASTLDQGGLEDLYLLRREASQEPDRVAQVVRTDPTLGALYVDRRYLDSVPPTGERVELHHLPPEALRRAVLAGLRRTWLREGVAVADPPPPGDPVVPATGPIDLTALAPWLILPEQVLSVTDTATGAPVDGWDAVMQGGHAYLLLRPGGAYAPNANPDGTARYTVWGRRQQFTLVNGVTRTAGPQADGDRLAGPLEYLAAFAHAEAWRIARDHLEAAAAEGRMPTQAEAAAEATRQSVATCPWLWRPNGRFGSRSASRVGPLWGLPGAGGVQSPLGSTWINGPAVP